ncbi:hypothetical protein LEMLEM_LOCUS23338 [Lemmus lemmus]
MWEGLYTFLLPARSHTNSHRRKAL